MGKTLFDDLDEPDDTPAAPEPHTLARAGDPETSKQAAAEIAPLVNELQQWAAECVKKSPGKTQRELAAIYCPDEPRRIGRRLSECAKLGLVRRGEKRKCSRSGKNAETWWPVESEA
jgi:hypothetical protein